MAMATARLQFKANFSGGGQMIADGAAKVQPKTILDSYKQNK
jgi:hypothetical protein